DKLNYLEQYNRIVIEIDDSLKNKVMVPSDMTITGDFNQDSEAYRWIENNQYSYSINIPHNVSSDLLYQSMKKDINAFLGPLLGIKVGIELRDIECLVFREIQTDQQ